jgi:hypothetical protein
VNLIYITNMHSFAVRKEANYRYYEVIRLNGGRLHIDWDVICGYLGANDAFRAAEAMEKWEMFGEKVLIAGDGVPKEDLPPHLDDIVIRS